MQPMPAAQGLPHPHRAAQARADPGRAVTVPCSLQDATHLARMKLGSLDKQLHPHYPQGVPQFGEKSLAGAVRATSLPCSLSVVNAHSLDNSLLGRRPTDTNNFTSKKDQTCTFGLAPKSPKGTSSAACVTLPSCGNPAHLPTQSART